MSFRVVMILCIFLNFVVLLLQLGFCQFQLFGFVVEQIFHLRQLGLCFLQLTGLIAEQKFDVLCLFPKLQNGPLLLGSRIENRAVGIAKQLLDGEVLDILAERTPQKTIYNVGTVSLQVFVGEIEMTKTLIRIVTPEAGNIDTQAGLGTEKIPICAEGCLPDVRCRLPDRLQAPTAAENPEKRKDTPRRYEGVRGAWEAAEETGQRCRITKLQHHPAD